MRALIRNLFIHWIVQPPMAAQFRIVYVGIILSKPPPPPQYDLSPQRSPAAGTRLDEPGVPHILRQQTEKEETFLFQAGFDVFLRVDCTRIPEQGVNFPSQADFAGKAGNSMLLLSGNPFKYHEEVLSWQSMIPPKRFDIFSSWPADGQKV